MTQGQRTLFTIYFATTGDSVGKSLLEHVADKFGGYTLSRTSGGWVAPDGQLITEPSWRLEIIAVDDSPHNLARIKEIAQRIKREEHQESVVYTYQTLTFCTV